MTTQPPVDSVPVLSTQRLILRRMCLDDAPFMLDLLNQPSWLRFIGDRGVTNLQQARDYIANGAMASYQRFGFGFFVVEMKGQPGAIGTCGLAKRDYLEDVDLGYALLPQYWSQGFASEASIGVIEYARNVLKLPRLVATTTRDNTISIRLLEKLGFRLRETFVQGEKRETLNLFVLEL